MLKASPELLSKENGLVHGRHDVSLEFCKLETSDADTARSQESGLEDVARSLSNGVMDKGEHFVPELSNP